MSPTLHHLARLYRASAAGRSPGAARDFTVDYEQFLRRARAEDGDARELAERELAAAVATSGGLLRIDRHPKSRIPSVIRLARDGGETWLFQQIDETPPTEERRVLADFIEAAATAVVPAPWRESWKTWCASLAENARIGHTVHPFRRDDSDGNARLLRAITGVLNWRGPALIRYASAAITGDSKQLQALEPAVLSAITAVTGHTGLAAFGIHPKPRFVTVHGPLALVYPDAAPDCAAFPAPISLAESNLARATAITTTARLCLTVENEDTFHALAAAAPAGVLLVLTSYAGSAVRALLSALPENLPIHHFGDADPAGSDILRDLREKTGRDILPFPIQYPAASASAVAPFSPTDQRLLRRLLEGDLPEATRAHLESIENAGGLHAHEQEHIPIADVLAALRRLRHPEV